MIEEIKNDPRDFAIQALLLANTLSDHLEVHQFDGLRQEVIKNISFSMLATFVKIPAKALDPMEVIKMIQDVYGEGGPFRGQKTTFAILRDNSPSFIAALYYLQSIGEEAVSNIGKSDLANVIVASALVGGRSWKGLESALGQVDALCGTQFLGAIPTMLENAHLYFGGTRGAQFLQERGGIARLKAIGADLDKVSQAVMTDLASTDLNEVGFPLMYAFLKDATLDLQASGAITRLKAETRFSALMDGVLHALSRPKNLKHACWTPILKDLSKYAGKEVNQIGLVSLAAYLMKHGETLDGFDFKSQVNPDRFKSALKKVVDGADRYKMIEHFGLESFFTRPELLVFKGDRLKGDLGM
jgi:hypothetical protein